jgi:hypothetical protein
VGVILAEMACGADLGKFGTVGVTFAELACGADSRAIVTLVTLVTVNCQLYITGLIELYERSDAQAAATTSEKRGAMSISFLLSLLKRHYTRFRSHKRSEATAGSKVLKSSCGKPQEPLFFYLNCSLK